MFSRTECDSREGIKGHLDSLTSLRLLLLKRALVAQTQKQPLKKWVLPGGLWALGSKGEIGYALDDRGCLYNPIEAIPEVTYGPTFKKQGHDLSFVQAADFLLPEEDTICRKCRQGWTVWGSRDLVVNISMEWLALNQFIGMNVSRMIGVQEVRNRPAQVDLLMLRNSSHEAVKYDASTVIEQNFYGMFRFCNYMHASCLPEESTYGRYYLAPVIRSSKVCV